MILLQIKCICLMLINNNKLNNNKLPYLCIVGVYEYAVLKNTPFFS